MTDRTVAMKRAMRAVNDAKFDRVRAVIAQIKDQGRHDDFTASIIARRAGFTARSSVTTSTGRSPTPSRRSRRGSSSG